MKSVSNQPPKPTTTGYQGLVCRGCMANCPHKDRCQGTPWRVDRAAELAP